MCESVAAATTGFVCAKAQRQQQLTGFVCAKAQQQQHDIGQSSVATARGVLRLSSSISVGVQTPADRS
ncbi:hypothetical protein ABNX05_01905 [Lysinibacillus sp. M3]|uniref:Uncharacterized protein n=1 Tax=Lysinibacillus zambalensis TaxID=3160866 RepID=A0ABV1MLG8_9BACI